MLVSLHDPPFAAPLRLRPLSKMAPAVSAATAMVFDYRAQIIENCEFIAPTRDEVVNVLTARDAASGGWIAYACRVGNGDVREPVLLCSEPPCDTVQGAVERLHAKSAEALQRYTEASGFAAPTPPPPTELRSKEGSAAAAAAGMMDVDMDLAAAAAAAAVIDDMDLDDTDNDGDAASAAHDDGHSLSSSSAATFSEWNSDDDDEMAALSSSPGAAAFWRIGSDSVWRIGGDTGSGAAAREGNRRGRKDAAGPAASQPWSYVSRGKADADADEDADVVVDESDLEEPGPSSSPSAAGPRAMPPLPRPLPGSVGPSPRRAYGYARAGMPMPMPMPMPPPPATTTKTAAAGHDQHPHPPHPHVRPFSKTVYHPLPLPADLDPQDQKQRALALALAHQATGFGPVHAHLRAHALSQYQQQRQRQHQQELQQRRSHLFPLSPQGPKAHPLCRLHGPCACRLCAAIQPPQQRPPTGPVANNNNNNSQSACSSSSGPARPAPPLAGAAAVVPFGNSSRDSSNSKNSNSNNSNSNNSNSNSGDMITPHGIDVVVAPALALAAAAAAPPSPPQQRQRQLYEVSLLIRVAHHGERRVLDKLPAPCTATAVVARALEYVREHLHDDFACALGDDGRCGSCRHHPDYHLMLLHQATTGTSTPRSCCPLAGARAVGPALQVTEWRDGRATLFAPLPPLFGPGRSPLAAAVAAAAAAVGGSNTATAATTTANTVRVPAAPRQQQRQQLLRTWPLSVRIAGVRFGGGDLYALAARGSGSNSSRTRNGDGDGDDDDDDELTKLFDVLGRDGDVIPVFEIDVSSAGVPTLAAALEPAPAPTAWGMGVPKPSSCPLHYPAPVPPAPAQAVPLVIRRRTDGMFHDSTTTARRPERSLFSLCSLAALLFSFFPPFSVRAVPFFVLFGYMAAGVRSTEARKRIIGVGSGPGPLMNVCFRFALPLSTDGDG
ncbi:hypothetical protein GGR56DRAFT_310932 [Xylariaceae sp. FL0804]|nr:hypothetical protein GGR56DRAFT_310932 [Xylariaceae sp. FL0804]